ncbi:MAG: hypothetical protein EBX19_04895 [Actinobacteria bacterium]|nr:hypothetical protein [Actinomycetota bacterium]
MLSIIKEIRSGFQQLFPGGRFRYVLIVLSVLAAVISVSELLVMKFFVNIVVEPVLPENLSREGFCSIF